MKNKKGLSTIVITVILIALVLVAIGIVWGEIGRAHVWTPVTFLYLVCRLLLEKKKIKEKQLHSLHI